MLTDAMRQRYKLIEHDPRDEKWAEWHIHPDTAIELQRPDGGVFTPTAYPPNGDRLLGFPVHITTSVQPGRIHLVAETDLDASIRHQATLGRTINVYKPDPMIFPPPAPAPTMKALAKHWADRLRKRARR